MVKALHMNQAQSFLDKIADVYYPNSTYPLSNTSKYKSFGLCEIADKLSVFISTNHLNTKTYITIIASDSIFKCITNYLCKEQVFLITESNLQPNDNQSSNFYLIHSKYINKSQFSNHKPKLIYSDSAFVNLIDIVNIPINLLINRNNDLFDIFLNSSIIFVYYSQDYSDQILDYIAKLTEFKIPIGVYTPKDEASKVTKAIIKRGLFDKVKFIKPLVLPCELQLIEHLLDHSGDEDFRKFYSNLFKVNVAKQDSNIKDMLDEIDVIMKNKCVRCYKKLHDDIKSLKSPYRKNELYRQKVEFSIIGTILVMAMLCKFTKDINNIAAKFVTFLADNIIFKAIYYAALCYVLILCVKYTDREFFRQNEESVKNYLNSAEVKLKKMKETYNFL